jgi:hypothetical protein
MLVLLIPFISSAAFSSSQTSPAMAGAPALQSPSISSTVPTVPLKSSSLASSERPLPSQQLVELSLQGLVVDSGPQNYQLSGGLIVRGSLFGVPIKSGSLSYEMNAEVSGLSAHGISSLALRVELVNGSSVSLEAMGRINESVPATEFPLGCGQPHAPGCTSEIPALFVGLDHVSYSIGDSRQRLMLPIGIESAYLNPFGGPILLTSLESATSPAIFIEANYSSATIHWRNVLLAGNVTGTFDSSQVSGVFSMHVRSFENLVTGVERDRGRIILSGVVPNGKPVVGTFQGISIIPPENATNSLPCSDLPGWPQGFLSGTCTATGLTSMGTMNLHSGKIHITGTYETIWSTPAVGFMSFVNATATLGRSHEPSHHDSVMTTEIRIGPGEILSRMVL